MLKIRRYDAKKKKNNYENREREDVIYIHKI